MKPQLQITNSYRMTRIYLQFLLQGKSNLDGHAQNSLNGYKDLNKIHRKHKVISDEKVIVTYKIKTI